MNNSFENYEQKIEYIRNNIKNNNKIIKTYNINLDKNTNEVIDENINNQMELNETKLNKIDLNEMDLNKTELNETELNEKKIILKKKIEENSKSGEKDFYCKQLDSLNYCLEMHKVRKNKKADFDIHSIQKHNIEDKDIDKCVEALSWKELSETFQKKLIEDFVKEISNKYNLEIEYTEIFVNSNLNKIKYDKYERKIVDIHSMINCTENDISILKIKQKNTSTTNSRINKLRKSLSTSKKSRFTVTS
jgi:hypothetical protein